MSTGNTTATPEYTLSIIEKAMTNATEFASIFNLYATKKKGGGQVDVIKASNELAQSLSETLLSAKGITRLASNDEAADKLVRVAKMAGDVGMRFFLNLQSYRLQLVGPSQKEEIAQQCRMPRLAYQAVGSRRDPDPQSDRSVDRKGQR
jgi:hypothetical protein